MLEIYLSHWDHSEVWSVFNTYSQDTCGKFTRRHGLSSSIVVCDIIESTAGYGEVVRPRENGAAIPRLGAGETAHIDEG
jgi:hypothetical protein